MFVSMVTVSGMLPVLDAYLPVPANASAMLWPPTLSGVAGSAMLNFPPLPGVTVSAVVPSSVAVSVPVAPLGPTATEIAGCPLKTKLSAGRNRRRQRSNHWQIEIEGAAGLAADGKRPIQLEACHELQTGDRDAVG